MVENSNLPILGQDGGSPLFPRDEYLFDDARLEEIRKKQDVENDWLSTVVKTSSEHKFTSTGKKISWHEEAMQRFHETGYATPIVSHIMPTDLCNLECSFCSVGNRTDAYKGKIKGLGLEKINSYLETLTERGLKAVILSGGGEPTAYRDAQGNDFRDLTNVIKDHELEIGLITNGTMLDKYNDIIDDHFKWIRVSLYPSEYGLGTVKADKKLPQGTTLGFSLVIADALKQPDGRFLKSSSEAELTQHYAEHLESILPFIQERNGQYLRMTPDCHTHGNDFIRLHNVAEKLTQDFGFYNTNEGNQITIHQHKMHGTPENCYLGFFHPVLYPDGLVYPCDSNILNDDEDRRFKQEYAIAAWDTVEKLYEAPVQSLVNTYQMCPRCVFTDNNNQLYAILTEGPQKPEGELPNHVNFI